MNKINQVYDKMKEHKILSAVILLCIMSGSVFGIWQLLLEDDTQGSIIGEGQVLSITSPMGDFGNIDATGSATATVTAEVTNTDGDRIVRFVEEHSFADDTGDTCTPDVDECGMSFEINDVAVVSGDEVEFPSSSVSEIEAIVDCIALSCPTEADGVNMNYTLFDLGEAPDTEIPTLTITTTSPSSGVSVLEFTATDNKEVSDVKASYQIEGGLYYDGTDFTSGAEVWLSATLVSGDDWSYDIIFEPVSTTNLVVNAYSIDSSALESDVAQLVLFTMGSG